MGTPIADCKMAAAPRPSSAHGPFVDGPLPLVEWRPIAPATHGDEKASIFILYPMSCPTPLQRRAWVGRFSDEELGVEAHDGVAGGDLCVVEEALLQFGDRERHHRAQRVEVRRPREPVAERHRAVRRRWRRSGSRARWRSRRRCRGRSRRRFCRRGCGIRHRQRLARCCPGRLRARCNRRCP